MQLMNANCDAPEYFYIFVDRCQNELIAAVNEANYGLNGNSMISGAFPMGMHPSLLEEYLSGSAWYLPFEPSKRPLFGQMTAFQSRVSERYWLEYSLELTRMRLYSTYPSRLSCLFAFGSLDDCLEMHNKRGWRLDSLKKYKLRDCGDANYLVRIARCNFKMIGAFERFPFAFLSAESQELLFGQYWSGAERLDCELQLEGLGSYNLKCGNRYEYLIEGILDEVLFDEAENRLISNAR